MSRTVQIRFLPDDQSVSVPRGTTLFTAAHWLGIAIDSTCGGLGTCGKCRVRIEQGARKISAADRRHLSPEQLAEGWRLACAQPASSDTVCRVSESRQIPRTATTGVGREVNVEPYVHKLYLELDPLSEHDTRADLERLRQALLAEGHAFEASDDLLDWLPARLRDSGIHLTATLARQQLVDLELGDTHQSLYGVAFDVGTTTVVGTLLDLRTGEVLAVESALNRQAIFGGDVISRIAHAMQGAAERREMRAAVLGTLNQILRGLGRLANIDTPTIPMALIVGNSTMLHLLLGVDARSLAVAPFEPAFRESVARRADELGLRIHPRGRVETFPLIGAYVGADIVAGLQATGLARQDEPWLFIDVGTNSEMALGSSAGVAATSAPAGPAFEGSCIRAGMAATRGAVERVKLDDRMEMSVVGDAAPRGLCGSGLIDLAAELLRTGLLDPDGRLMSREEAGRHPLADSLVDLNGERAFALAPELHLTQRDIRELQSAKSSVSTGVQVLMEHFGIGVDDLDRVLLAGSFGSALDPQSARTLGLVPGLPLEKIQFVGNVAAEGAKMALVSFRECQMAYDLAQRVEYIELSERPDFNQLFVEGVRFPSRPGRQEDE